jgi:hypothetical protein
VSLLAIAAALAVGGFVLAAHAQRDPACAEAMPVRQKSRRWMDTQALVQKHQRFNATNDINISVAPSTQKGAAARHFEEYALTAGCLAPSDRPGEKYQAPNGTWQTNFGPLQRDSRCPA